MTQAAIDAIRQARPVTATTHKVVGPCQSCQAPVPVQFQLTVCTGKEAADILQVCEWQLNEMCKDGRIPAGVWFSIGRQRRFWVEKLVGWMEAGGAQ